ncbi:MAG: hypothetical protein A2Z20_01215 [Bdellovibrionales bacterium RBG_16_40_8]|nr:MAG: hypothetical protein A2Z20_01215 [Bdellovibrionales bacterium RBG_16_40_8]
MGQWFIMQDEKIKGPYAHEEVKALYEGGQITRDCLIWGRSQDNWQGIVLWINTQHEEEHEMTFEQLWHFAIDGNSKGPLSRKDLVAELRELRYKGEILVWTKGMSAWADIFDFHDLLDEIGINRREHPRAHIAGSVVVKFQDKTMIGLLKTIGPGGFGATQIDSILTLGQTVTVELKSERLNAPLVAKATVQYASDTGLYGFKFNGINMESRAHIMDYIRRSKNPMESAA